MRVFSFSLLLGFALLFGSAWYWVVAEPMKFLDPEYPMWKAKVDMIDRCEVGTIATLGDSKTMAAVIPDKVGPGVVNLNLGGTGILEAIAVSKRILACSRPPEAVILSIKFTNLNDVGVYWDRTNKFGLLLSWHDMEKLRYEARTYHYTIPYFYGYATPFDIDARLKNALYAIKFPAYYFSALVNARINARYEENLKYYEDTKREKGHHYFGMAPGNWKHEGFPEWTYFKPAAFQASLLTQFLQLYADHHVPVYFVSPPYNAIDTVLIHPSMTQDLADYLASYEKAFPNFHVVGPLFPSLPPEDFGDMDHTNPQGAAIWSAIFARTLREANIPGADQLSP